MPDVLTKRCCPFCGEYATSREYRKSENHEILVGFDADSYMGKCAACGSLYLGHLPGNDELSQLYGKFFQYPSDYSRNTINAYKKRLRTLGDRLGKYNPRFLEIGCAGGNWLYAAKELGWKVEGNDLNRDMLDQVSSNVEVETHHGFFEDIDFGTQAFDIVIAMNVYEHLRDHNAFVAKLAQVVAPNGMFLMKTPLADSWAERVEGADWVHLKELGHIIFGTRLSITHSFVKHGFDLVHYENAGFPPRLSTLLRSEISNKRQFVETVGESNDDGKFELRHRRGSSLRRRLANIAPIKPAYFFLLNLFNIGDSAYFTFTKK